MAYNFGHAHWWDGDKFSRESDFWLISILWLNCQNWWTIVLAVHRHFYISICIWKNDSEENFRDWFKCISMPTVLDPDQTRTLSHRKLTCVDLRWHQSNGGTSRHKFCTFASLTFLTWYVSYDSPLKRCLWWNLNKLKLVASHRKLAVKRGTSVHKLKTCDDLRSRLIRALRT